VKVITLPSPEARFPREDRRSPAGISRAGRRNLDEAAAHADAEGARQTLRGLAERGMVGDEQQAAPAFDPAPDDGDLGPRESRRPAFAAPPDRQVDRPDPHAVPAGRVGDDKHLASRQRLGGERAAMAGDAVARRLGQPSQRPVAAGCRVRVVMAFIDADPLGAAGPQGEGRCRPVGGINPLAERYQRDPRDQQRGGKGGRGQHPRGDPAAAAAAAAFSG